MAATGTAGAGTAATGTADAESGGVPLDHTLPTEATTLEPDPRAAGQSEVDQPKADQPVAGQAKAHQGKADEATPAALATDQPRPTPQSSPTPPETPLSTGVSEDAGPLRLVRIGAEADDEAWPEDPWLPGSRRPDRRALIIGVVLIAGLLSVASTAWLVRVSPPQAGSPHETHLSRPSQLGSGRGQPRQALSGQPTPILTEPSQSVAGQPAPTQTSTVPARPGHTGHSQPAQNQPGHDQSGHNQSSSGHPGTSPSGTGHSRPGQPGPSQAGTHRTGSGQTSPGQPGPGRTSPGQPAPGQSSPSPSPSQGGSGPSGTGHSGTGRGTSPTAPHPRRSAPGSRDGGAPRHPRPGVVSISAGLAGRADAQRVGGLLARYFAAVNHRRYQAYARLFAQRRQLTPRDFAWGYQTSHDSNAVLAGIAALNGGLKATVTFTSQQDPAQSPDHSSCINWRITLFLHHTGATYLIGTPPPGYQAGLQACSFGPRQSSQGHSSHRTAKHPSSTHRSSQHLSSRRPTAKRSTPRHSTPRHAAHKHGQRKHR